MLIKKIMWVVVLGIFLVAIFLLIFFFQPLFLRRSYIRRMTEAEIPRTAQIIEYRFGISSFGVEPFFAKLELSQEDFAVLREYFSISQEYLYEFNRMRQDFSYMSLNDVDIAEIGWLDRLTSRTSIFLVGSSRWIQTIIIATNDGEYFLYVFHQ